jgi:hypothetical protein
VWRRPPARTGVPLARAGPPSAPSSRRRPVPPSFPRVVSRVGPPGASALVPIVPFREPLSDGPAAEAVRARMDWQYRRGLE